MMPTCNSRPRMITEGCHRYVPLGLPGIQREEFANCLQKTPPNCRGLLVLENWRNADAGRDAALFSREQKLLVPERRGEEEKVAFLFVLHREKKGAGGKLPLLIPPRRLVSWGSCPSPPPPRTRPSAR